MSGDGGPSSQPHASATLSAGASTRRAGQVLWRVVAITVLLSYNTWVWIAAVNGHVWIMKGYLSELSASDQPNNLFFRLGDGLTAVLVAVIAIAALRGWPASAAALGAGGVVQRWWRSAAVFLLVFAVSTGLDAITAMDCSPTLSVACAAAEDAGTLSWAHYLHTFTSVGAQIGIVGSMVAASRAERARYLVARRSQLFVVTVIETVALVIMSIMLAADLPGLGYPQAVMVLLASIWFAVAAVSVSGGALRLPARLSAERDEGQA